MAQAPAWLQTLLQAQEEQRLRENERREEDQRRRDEDQRRRDEEQRRRDEEQRQRDENQRREFQELITNLISRPVVSTAQESNQQQQSQNPVSNNASKVPRANRPSMLDVEVTFSKFRSWRTAWNDYYMLQKLEDQPLEVQKADFRCCLTDEMRTHLKCAIDVSDNNNLTVTQILDKIQEYLRQKRNIALDRVAFEERRQENGESFDDFYVALRKLAEESDLCDACFEQRIVTRVMSGIRDTSVRQKLLAITPFPDLKSVVNLCRSEESAAKDSSALDSKIVIDKVRKQSEYRREKKQHYSQSDVRKCGKCATV